MAVVGKATKPRAIPDALKKDRDTSSFMQERLDRERHLVPTGARVDWYGATAPVGWLLLAGQVLPNAKYLDLKQAEVQSDITYGASTMTLPVIANKIIKV